MRRFWFWGAGGKGWAAYEGIESAWVGVLRPLCCDPLFKTLRAGTRLGGGSGGWPRGGGGRGGRFGRRGAVDDEWVLLGVNVLVGGTGVT